MNQYPEQCLSGAILVDPRCLPVARSIVKHTDYQSAPCAAVFKSACRLFDAGKVIDPVTILDDAAAHGCTLDADYLMQLMELVPTAAHAQEYAEAVHNNAVRRAVSDLAADIQSQATDRETSPSALVSGAISRLQAIETGQKKSLVDMEEAAVSFLNYRDRIDIGSAVVSTGYKRIDHILGGGMIAEGLYILAARPGVGKTTIGLKIAALSARTHPVLFVSLEMSQEQLMSRLIADRTGLAIGKILLGHLTDQEHTQVCQALAEVTKTKLTLSTAPGATVADIALLARSIPDISMICIDYLGLIQSENRAASAYERTTDNSGALKRMARSLGIPILCLAQLNRASEQRTDKRPTMADLRDSGAIEQDADAVLLLHRPSVYMKAHERPRPYEAELLELDVAKNRHGPTGNINLSFYGTNGRIKE